MATYVLSARKVDELGPHAAGQSGDTQQLEDVADVTSESVEELVEEGNAFEFNVVRGVEDGQDSDGSELQLGKCRQTMSQLSSWTMIALDEVRLHSNRRR